MISDDNGDDGDDGDEDESDLLNENRKNPIITNSDDDIESISISDSSADESESHHPNKRQHQTKQPRNGDKDKYQNHSYNHHCIIQSPLLTQHRSQTFPAMHPMIIKHFLLQIYYK